MFTYANFGRIPTTEATSCVMTNVCDSSCLQEVPGAAGRNSTREDQDKGGPVPEDQDQGGPGPREDQYQDLG